MAAEEKHFSIDDVLDRLSNKLVDRHPHVFGDVKADTPGTWCELAGLKAEEKKKRQGQSRRLPTTTRSKIIRNRYWREFRPRRRP